MCGTAPKQRRSDDRRSTVVALLFYVPGPTALRLHYQRQDQRQRPTHDEDDAERVVRHKRHVDVECKEQDRTDHDQDNASSDTHVFLLPCFLEISPSADQLAFLADLVAVAFLAAFFPGDFFAGAFLAV